VSPVVLTIATHVLKAKSSHPQKKAPAIGAKKIGIKIQSYGNSSHQW